MSMQNQRRRETTYILTQAFAYLFGAIFLITFSGRVLADWVLPTVGYIFLAVAFFLLVSLFHDTLVQWANRLDYYLSGGLFAITLVLLVKTVLDIKTSGFTLLPLLVVLWIILLYVVLIFLCWRRWRQ